MSTSIDQRVVEMRFDNAQFESGVKTSLSTLDRLKQALSLDGFSKGLDNITKSANSINMNGLSTAVDSVGQRFSALETIATGALLNIGRQVESTATRMIKSLTVDNISAGFSEYELKMGSIQTIMAGTGEDLDTVNKYLNELNEYSDRTIYSFADMTENIGKFTNQGVKLKDAVAAIQGVANVAAVSGASANQASHAMMNFAQALSTGFVGLTDWKSIEIAQMATTEFKTELLKTAESLGTVKKNADGTYKTLKGNVLEANKGFRDSLKDQWMTTEVLTQTLARYSDETTELGQKAAAAATEVKTFTMMIDTVKEAVGSTWAKTWELIFGDFEEGKKLWTGMEKVLEQMFVGGGDEFNNWLTYWSDEANGGRTALLEAFSNLYYDLKLVVDPIKQAFADVFGFEDDTTKRTEKFGKILVDLTNRFKNFTRALAGDGSQFEKIREAARGVAIGFRILGNGLQTVFKILSPITIPLKSLANLLLTLAARFGPFMEGIEKSIKESETLKNAVATVSDAVEKFCVTLAALIDNFDVIVAVAQEIWGIFLQEMAPAFEETKKAFDEFVKPLKDFLNEKFGDAFERLWTSITSFDLSGALQALDDIFTRIKNSQKVQTVITAISTAIQFLSNHIQKAWKNIKEFVNSVSTAFSKGGILGAINEVIDRFKSGFTNIKNTIQEFVSDNSFLNFFRNIGKGSDDAVGPLERISNAIKGFVSQLTPGKLAVVGFSVAILALVYNTSKMFSAFSNLANAGADFLGIFKSFGKKNNVLRDLAITIGVLAGSLYLLSQIPAAKLKGATDSLLKLVGAAGAIAVLLTILSKIDTKAAVGSQLKTIAVSMVAFAGAAAIMALTLERIQELKISAGLLLKVGLLVGVIGALALIGKKAGGFTGSYQAAVTIVAFAGAIALVVDALVKMTSVDAPALKDSVLALVGVMTALAVLSRGIGSIGIISAIGLIALVFALEKVLPRLEALAGGDYKNIKKMLQDNIEMMVILADVVAGMMLVASLTGGGIEKFGKGMIRLAGALAVMVGVVYLLGKMDAGVAKRGTKALVAILGMFAVLELVSGISSRIAGGNKAFTKGIMTVSFASLLLVGAVAALGMLDPAQVKRGETALAGILGMLAVFSLVSAGAARLAGDNKNGGLKGVTAIIVGVAALAIELMALSFVPWEDLKHGMIALAVIVGLLSAAVLAMSNLKPIGVLTFIETLVLLGSMVGALYLLSTQPWENIIAAAGSIAILAVGLSGALALLTIAGAAAGPALIGIGLLDIFLVDLAAIIALMGTFNIDAINKGIDVLNTLGFGLGAAIGNFVSGIGVGITNGLPMIGLNLSMFAITAKPFFDMMQGMDFSNIGTGIKDLASAMLTLAESDFVNRITTLLGGGTTSMEKFGQDLAAFGSALVQYSDTVSGKINEEAITSSVNAGKMLTELNDAIPNSGGFLADLIGDNTFATFKVGLVGFGRALAEYSGIVAGKIDETAVSSSVNAGKMLAELNDNIPNSGGALASFLGDNTWSTFSTGLAAFGRSLVAFSGIVAGKIDETAITAAANAGSMMAKLNTEIPNTGGAIAFFTGDNDFSSFGKNLVDFGNSIVKFAETTNGINAGQMTGVISATRSLVTIAGNVASSGAGDRGFSFLGMGGKNQFESFGKNLVDFAKQIQKFSTELSGISSEQLSTTATSFKNLVDTLSNLANVDVSGITSFSSSMESLGHLGVQNFIMTFTGAEESVQTAISTFVGYIITDLTAKVTELNTAGAGVITDVTTGMDTEASVKAPASGQNLITQFKTGLTQSLVDLQQAGADAVNGFINGVNGNMSLVRQIGASMGAEFKGGLSDETGWNSPWTSMIEAGRDAVRGLEQGASENNAQLYNAGKEFGHNYLEGFRDELGWHSTPDYTEDETRDAANGMLGEAKKYASTLKTAGETLAKPYLDGITNTISKAGTTINEKIVKPLSDAGTGSGSAAFNTVKELYESLTGSGNAEEAVESLTNAIAEETEATNQAATAAANAGNEVAKTSGKVKSATKAVKEAKEDTSKYFDLMRDGKDVITAFQERFGAAYADIGDTAPLEASKRAVEMLALSVYEANKKTDTTAASAGKNVDLAKKKLEDIKAAFEGMRSSLTSTISGQMDIFKEFSSETKTSAADMLKNMRSQIQGVTDWSNGLQELAARGIDQGLLKKLSELGPNSYDYVNAFVQMTGEQLQEANSLYATSLQLPGSSAVSIMASYAYAGANATDGFIQGLQQHQAEVDAQMTAVAESGKTALNAAVINYNESGQKGDEAIGQGVTDGEPVVERATAEMIAQVVSAANQIAYENGGSVAANLIQGIANGLTGSEGIAIDAANQAMAHLNKAGVETPQQIASPSKVWANYGRFLDLGMAQGLLQYANVLTDSATQVGDTATSALQTALAQISTDGLDGSMQPVISPVLDLTGVQNGLGTMNGMFNSQAFALSGYANIAPMSSATNQQMMMMLNDAINRLSMMQSQPSVGDINVTVNAQGIDDPNLLADVVAQRIYTEILSREAVVY